MSLTRIGSIGINTGIAFAGVTTIVTLNTANDALSIGATVNVGSGITLGASGDIFATGVSTVTTLKVGSGVTVSSDGDIFATGVTTATTFSGSGANLTNLPAANLTGTLPAISGANLTNLDASDLASGTVPTARLGSGTASSSTFLRGDSTFQTVNTDLVSDTSPQLGGELQSNGNDIRLADSDILYIGTSGDGTLYHDGSNTYLSENGTGELYVQGNTFVAIRSSDTGENMAKFIRNGAVELYYDNSKKIETMSSGAYVEGYLNFPDNGGLRIGSGNDLRLYHDGSHSYIENNTNNLYVNAPNFFHLGVSNGGEKYLTATENGAVELYHDNTKVFETVTQGIKVYRTGTSNYLVINAAYGGAANQALEASGTLDIYTNSAKRARFDADGLKFGSDTAAVNALDDYEEGSWTPTIISGGWSISSTNYMKYVKVGGLVHIQFYFGLTGSGSNTPLRIGGLPFSNPSSSYSAGIADIGQGGVKGAYHRVESNSSQFEYFYSSENNSNSRIALNGNQIGSAYLIGSFSYFTGS
tara:strand:+ start:248 stop:1837 length:1590 start_codon:yes stop_codon:yes gene_type:complete